MTSPWNADESFDYGGLWLGCRSVRRHVNRKTTGDFIVAEGVLHHVANLEPCLRHLHELLEPDGLLIAVEFEGPFRFQLEERQVRWINAALLQDEFVYYELERRAA
jgi:2-polyprenyl-3-methyl-5-hydroxy-6-metoxy-1,4-benzoquinol methylase